MKRPQQNRAKRWSCVCAALAACVLLLVASAFPAGAAAEQASEPGWPAAAGLDAGGNHSCALVGGGALRCWGFSGDGQLGYGNTQTIGDDETPGSVGPVALGVGLTATAISAGTFHTCVLLDDGSVRCWGFGANGRLGYGNVTNVGDTPGTTPGSAGPVNLGRSAIALAAGGAHTCAVLNDGSVRCWGYGLRGALGYGNVNSIGDDESPGSVGPVNLGLNPTTGLNHTALAVTAGDLHTCALLDDHSVRCWGYGQRGALGYGNVNDIGEDESPGSVGPVNLGGRPVKAISAGNAHTCARLDDGSVRCWGAGDDGRLGYANTKSVGATPTTTPDTAGPVDLGMGRTATAVSAGLRHTCARLDDGSVRCWGYGGNGRLGYCNQSSIGDDETPGAAGPVDIGTPSGGAVCPPPRTGGASSLTTTYANGAAQSTGAKQVPIAGADAVRARGLRTCLAAVTAHAQREQRLARRGSARRRARARRHLSRHARSGRRHCLRLFARTPGRVTGLRARTIGRTQIELSFNAAGTDGSHPPPARSYVVKQSFRPIRSARAFSHAQTLCKGACRFTVSRVGGKVSLTVTDLRPRTTYYYAVAARDNVSAHRGPSSPSVKAKTR